MTVGPTLDALLRFAQILTRTDKPVSGPICDNITAAHALDREFVDINSGEALTTPPPPQRQQVQHQQLQQVQQQPNERAILAASAR